MMSTIFLLPNVIPLLDIFASGGDQFRVRVRGFAHESAKCIRVLNIAWNIDLIIVLVLYQVLSYDLDVHCLLVSHRCQRVTVLDGGDV